MVIHRQAGSSPTDSETSSVGEMLHLNCHSLENRRRDVQLVMMCKIASKQKVLVVLLKKEEKFRANNLPVRGN